MSNVHPVFDAILRAVHKADLDTDRITLHFDVLVKRPPHEGAQCTVIDLDNFLSPGRRARLEAVLSCLVEEQLAEGK